MPSWLEFGSPESPLRDLMPNPFLQPSFFQEPSRFHLSSTSPKSLVPGRESMKLGEAPGLNKLHCISQKQFLNVITEEFHITATV